MRPTAAALVVLVLLLAPATASASHLDAGADCSGAAAYLARIEARIAVQRAAYNASNAQLTAAKDDRDDLAADLVDTGGPVDDLTDALADALVGQGTKMADVIEATQDAIDDADPAMTDEEAQDEFFAQYDTLFGLSTTEVEDALDPDNVADLMDDLVGEAVDTSADIIEVLEARASAHRAKRSLDQLGPELRLLGAEHTAVRQLCAINRPAPVVPSSEPTVGSAEGPSDTDLLEALFNTRNVIILIGGVRDDYVNDVLEVMDPLLDSSPDINDIEDALDDAMDGLDDHAETIDRAIDLHLGTLEALDFDAPTDPGLVEDREDAGASSAERTAALADPATAAVVLRTNSTFARSAVNAARVAEGKDVHVVVPTGALWPTSILVVGADADPGSPVATLASNGTTKLIPASYDLYAVHGATRTLLRSGVAVTATSATIDAGGAVRLVNASAAPAGARWGIVPAGGILLSSTPTQSTANATQLGAVGAAEVFLQVGGRIETYLANTTLAAGSVRDVAIPAPCTASADAIVLDLDDDGLDLSGSTSTALFGSNATTTRWTKPGLDDVFLLVDATDLRDSGTSILTPAGVAVTGLALARGGLTLRSASGVDDIAVDGVDLLRALDSNTDGKLDANDPAWDSLRLWNDADGDGVIAPSEATGVAGLTTISTSFEDSASDAATGNVLREGSFAHAGGGSGDAADVLFAIPGRCGNAALPVVVTPTPTPTPTPTATTPTATTMTTPVTTTPEPTGEPTPTPTASPTPTQQTPSPTPTPTEQVTPRGPIPGPGIALVLALAAAIAVIVGKRR